MINLKRRINVYQSGKNTVQLLDKIIDYLNLGYVTSTKNQYIADILNQLERNIQLFIEDLGSGHISKTTQQSFQEVSVLVKRDIRLIPEYGLKVMSLVHLISGGHYKTLSERQHFMCLINLYYEKFIVEKEIFFKSINYGFRDLDADCDKKINKLMLLDSISNLCPQINKYALSTILGLSTIQLDQLARRLKGIKEGKYFDTLHLETALNNKYIFLYQNDFTPYHSYKEYCLKTRFPLLSIYPRRKKAKVLIQFLGDGNRNNYYQYIRPIHNAIEEKLFSYLDEKSVNSVAANNYGITMKIEVALDMLSDFLKSMVPLLEESHRRFEF